MNKQIIVPKRQLVLPSSGFAGLYKIEAIRPNGKRRMLADWFPNLITDVGLDDIGYATGTQLSACVVGTGGATPTNSDTALQAQIASTTTVQSNTSGSQPSAPYYGWRTRVYRFAVGAAAGNLAEVGIKTNTGGGKLFSRALILDGGGSPTTITVLSDEILDVTYQLRLYPLLTDITGTIDIGGTDYDFTARAANVDDGPFAPDSALYAGLGGPSATECTVFTGAIGAITGNPSGSSAAGATQVQAAYTPNSLFRDATFSFGLNNGNVSGGFLSVLVTLGFGVNMGRMQVEFDAPVPKDNTKVMSLTFRHSWARKSI